MFIGDTWPKYVSLCSLARRLGGLIFIQLCSIVMFIGSLMNITYVPRPQTYIRRFLADEHLPVSCNECIHLLNCDHESNGQCIFPYAQCGCNIRCIIT
jgi:hypothetical protein